MLFTTKLAATAATIFSMTNLAYAADLTACQGDTNVPFERTTMYGKNDQPNAFCETKWQTGILPTGIQVWATKNHVKGVQLTYSDGSVGPLHGSNTDTEGNNGAWWGQQAITWKSGDLFTDVHMAANYWGNGDGLGMIHMEIPSSKALDVKSDVGSYNGEPQNLASGMLVGAYGSAGGFVTSFGLMFMKNTAGKAEIVDFQWPESLADLNKKQEGVTSMNVKTASFQNSGAAGSGNQTYTFSNTEAQQTTISTTQSQSNTFGVSVAVEVGGEIGVPLFAEGKASVTTTASYQYTSVTSLETQKMTSSSLLFSDTGSIAPGKGAVCTATAQQGHYSTTYQSIVRITLNGGYQFNVTQPGQFDSVGFSNALVNCKVVDIADLPSAGATELSGGSSKRAIGFTA